MSESPAPPAQNLTLTVLFPTGDRISYDLTKETTVSELIRLIRDDPQAKKPANRNIVIIYQGRILQSTDVLSSVESQDEFTVHAFFRAIRVDAPNPEDLRGFDRLARMNYTPEQIAELRRNFHVLHGTTDGTRDAQLDAEEEWCPVIFNHENPLQDLQLPAPAGRRQRNANPLVNNEGEEEELAVGQGERTLDNFPSLKFVCGMVMGLIFGVGSLVFLLIALQDGPFMLGLFSGTCAHYALKYYFGS
jgi:hypothetical protein